MTSRPIITITTDFGLADAYVAAVKGVILSLAPHAAIVDISHAVRPRRVEQGSFLLEAALPYFPPGTVHLAVVDPGVGTRRRPIALQSSAGAFVGPDNGLLSPALPEATRLAAPGPGSPVPLPQQVHGAALTDPRYHRHSISDTFHGRDIFAPVAAHLALEVPLTNLGEPLDTVFALPPFRAPRQPDGSLRGRVVHIDRFGNAVTDVRVEDLTSTQVAVEIRNHRLRGLSRTYAEASGLTALAGSSGFLEIALPGGNAADELRIDIDEPLIVRPEATS